MVPGIGQRRELYTNLLCFPPLCGFVQLLLRLGFEERRRGSHHTFRKDGIEEKINLQRDDSKAKAYQVRQVRTLILKYKLGGEL
jgi:hypothetical protein